VTHQKSAFRICTSILALFILVISLQAQPLSKKAGFSHQDTLRGTITPDRAWWDANHYAISVTPDYTTKTIRGTNTMVFSSIKPGKKMQIDLQEPMQLDAVIFENTKLSFTREGNAFTITFPSEVQPGNAKQLILEFSGKPREAIRPPWDGGWIWQKDENGSPWMSVACQGLGASVWYPCKDHQSDEPDSASLTMIVPDTLVAVGNGRLREVRPQGNAKKAYTWAVTNPINNYNIIPYIGKYVNFTETFQGEKGVLDCSYWVLNHDLQKAKEQFTQAAKMLKCFEHWFGPYPFYEDGFKLVQSPHLGMEHQSAVAYGNKFKNGYLGRDLSGSGWGLKWDFIIVHESGHEWFANNITTNDIADMWVHEGFTNYSETLFTTCEFGVEAGNDYVIGTRKNIQNDITIIGSYGVNQEGSGDMYYKGGNLLHTIRQVVNDDEKFRQILRGLNKDFYHKTVDSKQVEAYISEKSGIDLSKVFDQYLRTTVIPILEYRKTPDGIQYRWSNTVPGFNLPLKVSSSKTVWIQPTADWKVLTKSEGYNGSAFTVDRNFYVQVVKTN
jgi:aminopeptidase N